MLFLVGLELEIDKVISLKKLLLGLGGMQMLLTSGLITLAAHSLGFAWPQAIVIGLGTAMSSTAIGLTALIEKRQLDTTGGQAAFSTLLFQDLSVIPIFMIIALLAPGQAQSSFDWMALIKAIGMIAGIILISRFLLKPVMRFVATTEVREIFVALSLLVVIGVALAMEAVGLSMALGTFLAGVLLADSEYRYELRLDIEPIKGLLLGLFFIAVGMSIDLSLLVQQPLVIIGFALAIITLKIVIMLGLAKWFNYALRDGFLYAITLSQIGEFAFVIFGLGVQQHLLTTETYNLLNAIVAVSMLLTPVLLVVYAQRIKTDCTEKPSDTIEENHDVIIAGFGRFGQIVGRVLHGRGIEATLIDNDPNQVDLVRNFGWRCYYGDAANLDLLVEAGINTAKLFVIAIDDPHTAIETAKLVQERWPHVKIIARARGRSDAFDFRDLALMPIRETFYSGLEAAKQALIISGETETRASNMVKQFEAHDSNQLEASRKIRHDRPALMSQNNQARADLQTLFQLEQSAEDNH